MHVSKRPIEVLFEDDHYIVFDKPAGLLVIPTPKNEMNTLVNIVNQQRASDKGFCRLHPCHRIDKETSGVIIFAKGKRSQRLMMDRFKERNIRKKYIAFVHGALHKEVGEFNKSISVKFGKSQRAIEAMTRYKVLEKRKLFSIVEVQPITGRTNQIRIHFSQNGHPLVGDRKYSFARDYALKFRRTALHAASIAWEDPISHKKISVQSDLPKDMAEFITKN